MAIVPGAEVAIIEVADEGIVARLDVVADVVVAVNDFFCAAEAVSLDRLRLGRKNRLGRFSLKVCEGLFYDSLR